MSTAIKICPSCEFSAAMFKNLTKRMNERHAKAISFDNYCVQLYWSRLVDAWVFECRNCGIEFIPNSGTRDDSEPAIAIWNGLARREPETTEPST